MVFSSDITSTETQLKTLNGGTVMAGWNRLVGPTTVNGVAASVELLASVDYVNGSGEFFGFVTLTLDDDSMLTMRMTGHAVKDGATGDTHFTSDLRVIGGTGVYTNAKGSGGFVGSREVVLGGPVHLDFKLNVN
jgi:hypothetical protein